MAITLVKKRSGSIADFDLARIERAIEKAYTATSIPIASEDVSALAARVMDSLELTFNEERLPSVEDVQNLVEHEIAKKGDFLVAKAYILYRAERAEARAKKQEELLEKMETQELHVKKRSGKIVPFDVAEIEKAIISACKGFEHCVNVPEIVAAAKLALYDGISTSEINKAVIMTLKSRIERDPAFSLVTARFLVNDLYKDVLGLDEFSKHFADQHTKKFPEIIKRAVDGGRLDPGMMDFDLPRLAATLDLSRDKLFSYMGVQILHDRYFLKDLEQKFLETPQYFWMRIAMGLALKEGEAKNDIAIDFYNTVSQMLYVPSTPTLLHSGTHKAQMSSCFLTTVEDDLHHIFKCIGDNAQLSKWSGGVANDWTNIRATNSQIKSINVTSQGVIPFLKIVDATTASINRSGKRRGATCVYLETWHMDIEAFLDLRKNTGDDRLRTHDTNTANWIPDLFMKRVQEGGQWTLFSPEEVPDLHHTYGKKFEERYTHYEKMADEGKIALFKRMKATDLWRKMITMLFETGHPWMTFKDPCNVRSPQDHVGVIHSSNLCTEITLNTSKEETAVCNIGSLNLPNHIKNGKLDYVLMEKSINSAMRMLDNTIDTNFYPVKEGEVSNMRHRPVGLGMMGMQDMLYMIGMNFDTHEAVNLSDELMEFISYHAIYTSSKLAKEKGAYSSFKGSKWDRGIFPVDTIRMLEEERGEQTGVLPMGKMDWTPVREHVKAHGMRNSNTMAIAPTATIANITGCLPSVEPIYKNIYVKSNFSGEFTIVNQYLVEDLKKLNLWNNEILEKIKVYDGNLSQINELPMWIRDKYKEVFQIDPSWIITHAAYRGKWIDQSQSINIFMSTESGKAIADTYMLAWKMGLKTTYYLRSLSASSIEKSTIDINKNFESPKEPEPTPVVSEMPIVKPKVMVFKDETCESCQ